MTLHKTLHHVFINSYEWNLFQRLRIIWNLSQQKVTVLLFIHLLFLCIRRLLYVDFSSLNCKIRNPRSPDHKRRIGHGISGLYSSSLAFLITLMMNIPLCLSKLVLSAWSAGRKMGTAAGDSSRERNFTGTPRASSRILGALMQHPAAGLSCSQSLAFGVVSSFPKAPGAPGPSWHVQRPLLLLLLLPRVFI